MSYRLDKPSLLFSFDREESDLAGNWKSRCTYRFHSGGAATLDSTGHPMRRLHWRVTRGKVQLLTSSYYGDIWEDCDEKVQHAYRSYLNSLIVGKEGAMT